MTRDEPRCTFLKFQGFHCAHCLRFPISYQISQEMHSDNSRGLGRVHFLQNRNWQNRTSSYFGSRKLAQISSLFCLVHISTIPISRRHTVYHSRNNYTELETDIVAELIDDLAFETFVGHGDTLKRSERTEQKKKAFETSAGRFKYQRERLRVELKHKHKQEHI